MKVDCYLSVADRSLSLWVPQGAGIAAVPASVLGQFKSPTLFRSFDLDPARPRVALDVMQVINDIQSMGYHVNRTKIEVTETVEPDPPR